MLNFFLVGYQISIGKQWKEFLDYKDSIGFIVHVSNALRLPFFSVSWATCTVSHMIFISVGRCKEGRQRSEEPLHSLILILQVLSRSSCRVFYSLVCSRVLMLVLKVICSCELVKHNK
jgi:hypothetical protein